LLDYNSTQEEHRQPPVGYVQLYCARPVESYNHWLRNAFLIIPQIAELYKLPSWIAKEVEGELKFVHHSTIATWRIDFDACNSDTAFLELFIIPSKADQLPVAVRSPVASVEY